MRLAKEDRSQSVPSESSTARWRFQALLGGTRADIRHHVRSATEVSQEHQGRAACSGSCGARSQSGPDGGASTSRALREGVDRDVLGLTRHAASPTANKRQACRPAPCDAHGTPAPQSQHTHSRSHSGTPHGQHSDACIFFMTNDKKGSQSNVSAHETPSSYANLSSLMTS